MKKKLLLLALLSLLGLGLSACNRPSSSTTCTPDDLVAPTLTNPEHNALYGAGVTTDSLPPEWFRWEFPSECTPEFFTLKFSPNPHFGTMRTGMTEGELSWPPADPSLAELPLEPATMYYWNVRAWTDGVAGPESATQSFFTGPMCERLEGDEDALSAPELIAPEPYEIIDEPHTEFQFSMSASGCLPNGYYVDFGPDPSFGSGTSRARLHYPGTYLISEELEDCTVYYWRVVPYLTNPFFGYYTGPPSETREFHTRTSGVCLRSLVTAEMPGDDLTRPHCTPEELIAPILVDPYHTSRFGYTVSHYTLPVRFFHWTYQGGCLPDKYHLLLSTDPDFGSARGGSTEGEIYWPLESPDPEAPLELGTQYFWRVQAEADGVLGPQSPTFTFFTGTRCGGSPAPAAPQLVAPNDGAVIRDRSVLLHYINNEEYKCWPDWFHIEVQTDPEEFTGITPETGSRSNISETSSFHRIDETSLRDCTTYFWRVAGILDRSSGRTIGSYSDVWSFSIDWSGACSILVEGAPAATASSDLPCLEGPDPTVYPTVGYLLAGERAHILAQSMDQQWWYVDNPDGTDICAVPMDSTTADGDISEVPRFNNPEIEPEESDDGGGGEPSVCAGLDFNDCSAEGCAWSGNQCTDP